MTEDNNKGEVKPTSNSPRSKISTHKNHNSLKTKLIERRAQLSAVLVTFVVVVLAVFFGIQYFTRSGAFHAPGQIIYDNTITEVAQDFVESNLPSDLELKHNIVITSSEKTTKDELSSTCADYQIDLKFHNIPEEDCMIQSVLYDILVPTTTWDDPRISVNLSEAQKGTLVSIWNLTAEQKLLQLSGEYYLDSFTSGALFESILIVGNRQDVEKIATQLQSKIATFPNQENVLTLAQTGVTALSRRMYSKLQQVGNATYFSEKIAPFLSQFDFTHTSNESSFSSLANGSNICSAPAMIDVLTSIGLDIVELTGNHNQDCGDQDAITTIEQYHNLGMQTFGGGVSADNAAIPLEINSKNTHITMLGYNLSTGGYTLDATPGANFYTEEKARADIAAAKERGDFIIVDIQYYECNEYVDTNENTICDAANSSAGDQIGFFRSLIDMGADIVVGTAAHQPQTFEQYHGGTIYYGLGNLFFDQSAWPGTTRSLVLVHYFWNNKLLQTRIVPTIYDNNFQTDLMSVADAEAFLQRLLEVRPANN